MTKVSESKQIENGSETVEDAIRGCAPESEEIRAAAVALREIIEQEGGPHWFWQKLFIALCLLVERSPETSSKGWTSKDLVAVVAEHFNEKRWALALHGTEKEVAGKARKLIIPHWKKLMECWDSKLVGIEQRLQEKKIALRPTRPYKEGEEGGSGNTLRFFLNFTQIDPELRDRFPTSKGVVSEVKPIRYFTDEIKSNPFLRWFSGSGLFLGGWAGRIFLGTMAAVLVASAGLTLMFLRAAMTDAESAVTLFQYALTAGVVIVMGWFFLGWSVRLVQDRCALAPMLLQPFSGYDDFLLELRRHPDAEINSIYLTRYTAICSICGGTVFVQSGRYEFSGRRLVGRCRNAPNAHVFSFDHETRWGRFLR